MPTFFLGEDHKTDYEKKHGKVEEQKPKRKYSRLSTSTKRSSTKKDLEIDSKYKPTHFDSKLQFNKILQGKAGKIISLLNFFTEKGLLTGLVYQFEDNTYKVQIRDINYKIIEEREFEGLEVAKAYLSSHISELGELENNGLIACLRDILTKVSQIDNENLFLFRLLVDPEERKMYELKELSDLDSVNPPPKRKEKKEEFEDKELDSELSKHAQSLREKFRKLKG